MSERIIKKQFVIKSKYPIRLFGLLVFCFSFVFMYLVAKYTSVIEEIMMMEKVYVDLFSVPIFCYLLFKGTILMLLNGETREKILTKPLQLVSGINDYHDLISKINMYLIHNLYEKTELHLTDTGNDEYFTMFTNQSNPIKTIGVYYSNNYYAEMGDAGRYGIKAIRLSNDKKTNAKNSVFINEFCGNKEDKYLSMDISCPPNPINKILIVMINPNEKRHVLHEKHNLEEWHESHVLFTVIYENKPDVLYVGPDVRLYSDDSYQYAIEELCKMLNIKYVDYEKLI